MVSTPVAAAHRARLPVVLSVYGAAAAAAVLAFAAGGILLATTLPYHDWDSFYFGDWSRSLAHGHGLDPAAAGQQGSARPFYYALQGLLWAVTGVSFSAGRLLSLAFAFLLVAGVAGITRELSHERPASWLAVALSVIVAVSIPALPQEALAGKSDVPAAAMVAVTVWLALRRPSSRRGLLALAVAAALTVVTKATTLLPLLFLAGWLFARAGGTIASRLRGRCLPVVSGIAAGIAYFGIMALHFHTSLTAYLETGTGGLWAQRAAADRAGAVLALDVFGGALRLPLAFALLYAAIRAVGLPHRRAAFCALPAALVWTIAGPLFASGFAPIENAEQGFAYVGFAALLAVGSLAAEDDAPSRTVAAFCLALGVPSLALWAWTTAYADRLASTSWPALAVLIALCLVPSIRVLRRADWTFAVVPVTVLAAAFWLSVSSFDGLHGVEWQEYRQLGLAGLSNGERTMNIVLPSIQSALATATPELGPNGRISVGDPRFAWFLPGRIDEETDLHCGDVHDRVFILLTSDESELAAQQNGGLATPEQWAKCPGLKQLSDGSDGYAVFVRS